MAKRTVKARRVKRATTTSSSTHNKVKGLARFTPSHMWDALHKKHTWVRIGQISGGFLGFILLVFLWYAKDLPSPNKVNARVSAQTTKLYDRTGQTVLLEVYGDKNRSLIQFDQMPQNCKNATVAVEDKNFYKHGAYSIFGLGRAFTGVISRTNKGGGSTITQQYVKNALLTNEHTYSRKIKELILSIEIEQLYNKDDILKLYLNEIPYGSTAYGLEAGAKTYFGKPASQLDLSECAMLAAMPQAPSYYSPYGQHKDALIRRQHYVLDKMMEQKYISKQEADTAKQVNVLAQVKPQNLYANVIAPHFVSYVRDQLEEKYGVKTTNEGGLKVITTLDLNKQKIAEDAISKNMDSVRKYGGSNAALVSADAKTNEILAMVGSYNYSDSDFGSFNVAVADRQPGSSFKPITYSTLFKKNYGAGTTLYDVTTDFGGGYKPKNYTGRTYGVVSIRQALSGSLNIPAVKALYLAGISDSLQTAKDLGITTLKQGQDGVDQYGLSLTLGTGEVKLSEMVSAYTTFPSGGEHRDQQYVLKVTDSTGKVLEENKPENNKAKQVLDPQIAFMINNIISDNTARCSLGAFSCRNPLTLGNRPAAAKTGTTEDYKDAWTMGYTKQIVTGVWAGNNDNKPMTQAASIVSAPIWNTYMTEATKDDPVEQFDRPTGIQQITIDADTGKLPTATTKRTRTDVFPSWYKAQTGSVTNGKIDKVSGKLATSCTPPDAIEDRSSGIIQAEIPPNDPSFGRWNPPVQGLAISMGYTPGGGLPTDNDNIHSCSDEKPSVSLNVSPNSGSVFTLTATAQSGTFPVNNYVFYFDDQQIASGPSATTQYTPAAGVTGTHSFKVIVFDTALYSATSTSKSVTVASSSANVSLVCSGSSCYAVVNNAPSGTITLSYKNGGFTSVKLGSGPTYNNSADKWPYSGGNAKVTVTDSGGNTIGTASYP